MKSLKICDTGCLGRRTNGLPQSLNWYQKALSQGREWINSSNKKESTSMNLEQDFEDFIALLNKHDVHYGVDFKDAYDHKYTIDIDGLIINYIGL